MDGLPHGQEHGDDSIELLIAYLMYAIRRPGDPNSSSSSTSTSQESGPFTSGITPDRPRRQRPRMTPGDAMRLGWRPPLHIGALAELGEECMARHQSIEIPKRIDEHISPSFQTSR